jgi:hypothetical protein
MKDDMARISTVKNLKSGSYCQRLVRFFDRYSATRLFLDLLLWVLQPLISEVDNFFGRDRMGNWQLQIACFSLSGTSKRHGYSSLLQGL